MEYTIGEMSKRLGIPASTLRYYDKEGLLPFVSRSGGKIRLFRDSDATQIRMILVLKKAGMQLHEIRQYIQMKQQGDEALDACLALFQHRQDLIRQQIEELQSTLDILEYKCWFYQAALEAGTTDAVRALPLDDVPEKLRDTRTQLRSFKYRLEERA